MSAARAALRRVPAGRADLDVERIRRDFPALRQLVHGRPLVYLDNAATTQKPQVVLDTLADYYATRNANVHRGVHALSERATRAYEEARAKVRAFLNAAEDREIVFVRGATEGINLVAQSWGRTFLRPNDEIVLSTLEHHSNIVPWQMLCEQVGARLRVIPINDAGELLVETLEPMLTGRTRLVAIGHVSNALGTVNPVARVIEIAHRHGIPVLVDGAQAVPHRRVDVRRLDCDFYVFSGHKVFGPTGIGVLYGKAGLLERMPPWQGGGDMISLVTFEKTHWNVLPYKFEAGTPNVAGAVGLGAALDYVSAIGLESIERWEQELLAHATATVSAIDHVRLVGTAREKAAVLSFVVEGVHAHDVGTIVDREGVAIRAGHHCAMPLMQRLGLLATARASFAFYNTLEEVDRLAAAVRKVREFF
jgi:cysteine desulfurase/selenocysteine lyase